VRQAARRRRAAAIIGEFHITRLRGAIAQS
jgi:hypothetical protein